MGELRMTRDFFLWCMSAIFLIAFSSLYVQIPGLYGDKGILPAKLIIRNEPTSLYDLFSEQPTLLRLLPRLGLDVANGMDFLCLSGIGLALAGMVSRPWRNAFLFTAMWACYFSLFQVGQTFLWFQWDILLLEAGFLCILLAPFNLFRSWRVTWYHQHDRLTFWLMRWLLFRLLFASGVVKLTSGCKTWWGLTALNYHYETQCLPTAIAWFVHQLPAWFQSFSVVCVYIIMIGISFLFFSPIRSQRMFAFYTQVFQQILILMTGNYNFFNLLTLVLCISLLDDDFLRKVMKKPAMPQRPGFFNPTFIKRLKRPLVWVGNILVFGGILYWSIKLFNISLGFNPLRITTKIGFTQSEFTRFLRIVIPLSIVLAVISLLWETVKSFISSLTMTGGVVRKSRNAVGVLMFGFVAFLMFGISLVDHTVVERQSHSNIWPILHQWNGYVRKYEISNSYGLFRSMTGVGGRPEVIIEGSNDMSSGWKEYDFQYKPGNVTYKPLLVAPHQPRLDWQMWFAALGSYQHNPWFLNLMWRILNNEPDVMALMGKNPFPDAPPKYVKATLYLYHFTDMYQDQQWYSEKDWWVRRKSEEYLPMITKDEPSLINYLREANIIENPDSLRKHMQTEPGLFAYVLQQFRRIVGQPGGFGFTFSLFIVGVFMSFLDPSVDVMSWPEMT